ncbi:hypothetical protein CROQUDRAFT_654523 [Cronartium quercuum f. sp. fusiforme G11]|uniref:Mitochondrial carrier protein n=1 Tax=Cronartium quercuum f. sp. fusiforme G11 TaxID=708437 RepID=A0A9P6TEF4_9BASI|nr:hypothetical protein CROQUDRAFT_654523 [Cronartium quercuum f. sp. fusiforme G11]
MNAGASNSTAISFHPPHSSTFTPAFSPEPSGSSSKPSPQTSVPSTSSHPSGSRSNPPGWVHFVAGGLGGMCGATVTAPFDLVKTRLQSSMYRLSSSFSPDPQKASLSKFEPSRPGGRILYHFIDTGRMIRDIQRNEGFRALFRGLGPTLAGAMPARSINFYVYGTGKELYTRLLTPGQDSSSVVHICAAVTAGIATATATNPIWVVKTRLQLDIPPSTSTLSGFTRTQISGATPRVNPISAENSRLVQRTTAAKALPHVSPFSSRSAHMLQAALTPSFQCMVRIYRQEGILGFYRGLSASYLGVAEGTIQWTLYEKFKRWGVGSKPEEIPGSEHWSKQMLAAGSAKLMATGITYPHEVVRTRMRQKPPAAPALPKYTGLYTTFKTVFAEEGIRAFYGGLSAHLLRVVPNAIVMYTVYETALSISRGRAAAKPQ